MNADTTDLERRLGEALHRELDQVSASRDLSGPAVLRSKRIRRNRTVATGVGAVVAAAVIASPFAWSSPRGPQDVFVPATTSVPETTATTPAPSVSTGVVTSGTTGAPTNGAPSPGTTGAPRAGTTRVPTSPPGVVPTPGAVSTGNADQPLRTVTVDPAAPIVTLPDLGYVLDHALHRGDRKVAYASDGTDFSLVELAAGKAVTVTGDTARGSTVYLHVPDGARTTTVRAAAAQRVMTVVANGAGTRFVVFDANTEGQNTSGVLTLHDERGTELLRKTSIRNDVALVGFLGNRFYLSNRNTGNTWLWDLDTNVLDRWAGSGHLVAINEATGRAALDQLVNYDEPRCTTVADVSGATPRPISVTCGQFAATEFSPDGNHLLGIETPSDGMLTSDARVVDVATGRSVTAFKGARPMNMEIGFLPDGSVALNLVTNPPGAAGAAGNTMMRCEIDGPCARLVDTIPLPDFDTTMAARYLIVR